MTAKLDPEVRAIRAIVRELQDLDTGAKIRIIRYALSRCGIIGEMRASLCYRPECNKP